MNLFYTVVYFIVTWISFHTVKCIEEEHNVILKIKEIRQINKSAICDFPNVLSVSMETEDKKLMEISLQRRSTNFQSAMDNVYVIRQDSRDKIRFQKEIMPSKKHFRFYYDPGIVETSMMLRCTDTTPNVILSGDFIYEDKLFTLHHTITIDGGISYHIRKKPKEIRNNMTVHDYTVLPSLHESHLKEHKILQKIQKQRLRRQINIQQPYIIDVLVIIDNKIYKDWYGTTSSEPGTNTKEEITTYFSHFMNEVALRYQGIDRPDLKINVKVSGYIIADRSDTFLVTELRKESGSPRELLDATATLQDFRIWVNNTGGLPPHDHVILFTGYNMYTIEGKEKQLHTAGLAFIRTMCRHGGDSVSIVEDHGGFQNVATAAHEIGHSLGARHDGENNKCSSEDRYIMHSSDYVMVMPPEKRLHQWHFSTCSLQYFKEFISALTISGNTCLTETFNSNTKTSSEVPGQIYSPDVQCKMIWGSDSYMCRGAEFGNASSICTALYCRDPNASNDCVLHTAARGTSCGNKKWCIEGICTYSEDAPEKDESCVLGDQPGIAFIDKTCDDLIKETPSYCYQSRVRARCCSSCLKHFTWVSDCQYGDRVKGCKPYHCNLVSTDENVLKECCSTCSYGVKMTTNKPTYTLRPITTTDTDTTSSTVTCEDTATVNGQLCQDFIAKSGRHVCYDAALNTACCGSCMHYKEYEMTGCEYGNRHPSFCSQQHNTSTSWCSTYGDYCCQTCTKTSTGTLTSQTIWPLLFTMFIFIVI